MEKNILLKYNDHMAKVLVIAEKKTVAQAIAEAFRSSKASDYHWEDAERIITFTNGHAVRNLEMAEYSPALRRWSLSGLPFLPDGFLTKVAEDHKEIVQAICSFYCRDDVVSVVCATDPEREGELIFREVLQQAEMAYFFSFGHAKEGVPVYRLWVSSMERDALLEGFSALRPDSEYDGLYYAALARNHADWIVGMNMTRYYTSLYGNADITYNVGRLISPIVAMVVRRKTECDAFRKTARHYVKKTSLGFEFHSPLLASEDEAKKLCKTLMFSLLHVTSVRKKSVTFRAPRLYCLNSLQMMANAKYALSASETLEFAQDLYERRLLSYPRTDSEFIERKSVGSFGGIMDALSPVFGSEVRSPDIAKIVDDERVSGHPALHLTHFGAVRYSDHMCGEKEDGTESLSDKHWKILDLVARRMVCATRSDAQAVEMTLSATSNDTVFNAKKIFFTSLGFLCSTEEKDRYKVESIPEIGSASSLPAGETEVCRSIENGPSPYTDGTLLRAMTEAGNDVLDSALVRKGLGGIGTSATRAEAIERVIESGYIRRVQDYDPDKPSVFEPTEDGMRLVQFADRKLLSEKTTASWETKLQKVYTGKLSYFDFIEGISTYVRTILDKDPRISGTVEVGKCPVCGNIMNDLGNGAWCSNADCSTVFYKSMKVPRHEFTNSEMASLLEGKIAQVRYIPPSGGKGWIKLYKIDQEATKKAKAVRLTEVKDNG